ncbi:MAG: hypothetical protein E7260_07720 [Lachnospiraceae bacterium]|nr:hypothetical protein [Lachnospiraceae bacterium]
MISPIGNSYGFYTAAPYASGSTLGAARTALADMAHEDISSVVPVDDVPDVFSNEETERVQRTPEQLQQDRRDAYEIMNSMNPRNAEHLNAPLEFMTKKEEIDFPFDGKKPEESEETEGVHEECETCANRTYVDGSNESDVSFKTPGHISPEASAAVVSAHEYEHVRNALQEDKRPDAELVSVSVSLKTAVCPECGTTYVAGGKTRTLMRYGEETNAYTKQQEAYDAFANGNAGKFDKVA